MSRAFLISHHARKRWRERYLTAAEQNMGVIDVDAQIDRLVHESIALNQTERVRDADGAAMLVVEIRGRNHNDQPLYACLKDDKDRSRPVITTILETWMRDANRRKTWTGPNGEKLLATPTGRTKGLRGPIKNGGG